MRKRRAGEQFAPRPLFPASPPEGILLRPALTLPLELYTPERVEEFDAAESELAKVLSEHP